MKRTMTPADLAAWRKKEGLTQQEAGEWYGLSKKSAARSWARYERGQRRIPQPLLTRIRDVRWQRANRKYREEPDDLARWKQRR